MSVGFGFSIGDFIAGIDLIANCVIALKDAGGASADYQLNKAESLELQQFLQQLQKPPPLISSSIQFDRIRRQARACDETLQSFLDKTSKFDGALGPSAAKGWFRGSRRKVQWALWSPVPKLRDKLGKHLLDLQLEMLAIDQQLLIDAGHRINGIERDTRNSFAKMDASFGKLDHVGHQVVNYSRSNHRKMDGLETQLRNGIEQFESIFNAEMLRKVYDWLSPLAGVFENKQLDTFNREGRQDGLGHWLLQTSEFLKWSRGTSGTLCCCGGPGIGKTVLVSFIIEHLKKQQEYPDTGIAYVYCDYKQASMHTPVNLIANVLWQLVRQRDILQRELKALYDNHDRHKTRPTMGECIKLLQAAVSHFSKVFIIIDALDELPEIDSARKNFLEAIRTLDRTCVLATSRNIPDENALQIAAVCIDIRAQDSDIKRYLEERMSRSDRITKFVQENFTLSETIKNTILRKAKGMFLLAFLHMESLTTKNDLRSLKDALNSLPERLDSAYDEVMKRIKAQSSEDHELATKVLYWISCALRPLALDEVQHALAVRPGDNYLHEDGFLDEERLLSVCAGIVAIQRESKTVILVHYTVQEYFKNQRHKLFPQAEAEITRTCLTYLSFDVFGGGPCSCERELEERLAKYPFLEYAATYWGNHFSRDYEQGAKHLVLSFLQGAAQVSCSIQVIHKSIRPPPSEQHLRHERFKESQHRLHGVHSLWLAAYFNLIDMVEQALQNRTDIFTRTGYGELALHAAARCGNTNVVGLLLNAGADINAVNNSKNSPLLIAVGNLGTGLGSQLSYESVIRLLIESGADVAAKGDGGWTALHFASRNGHKAVIQLLLKKSADISAKTDLGWTALHSATFNGHKAVIQLLLENSADIAAKTDLGWTALHSAALNGHKAVVQLLLENSADISAKTNDGWTALHSAAQDGHKAVVQLLLENSADISAKTDDGWTALHSAALNGHKAVVQLLLENSADISAKADDGWTALHSAVQDGHKAVVQLLLENSADIAAKADNDGTALHLAAFNGHKAVVQLLLENSADISAKADDGWTALHSAALNGHKAVVQLLLENSADISAKTDNGWTALHSAAQNGHEAVVKILIESGAGLEDEDKYRERPLHLAASNGHEGVVRLLLEKKVDLWAQTLYGATALHWGASRGHNLTVSLLLELGADVEARASYGSTALHWAAATGHEAIVRLLLENGADFQAKVSYGGNIFWKALQGRKELERLLEEADFAPTASNEWKLVCQAAKGGREELIQLLLEKRTDMHTEASVILTALQVAAKQGHDNVVQLLEVSSLDRSH